jgi:hypothetical protein
VENQNRKIRLHVAMTFASFIFDSLSLLKPFSLKFEVIIPQGKYDKYQTEFHFP